MKSSPVLGKERMVTIDIIRGFALFGIFLVNMPTFHSPEFMKSMYGIPVDYSGVDHWIDVFFALFVDMKFFTIFSFLFGLGFYIFMSRAEEKGLRMNRLYLRRIFALLLFGIAHLVGLWFGDILHTYAVAGLLLIFFYKRKIKTMVIWAFSLLFVINALFALMLLIPSSFLEQTESASAASMLYGSMEEYLHVYEHGNYIEWVSYRLGTEVPAMLANLIPAMFPVLAMFLFGLAAGKAGIFRDVEKHAGFIRKIRTLSFVISVPLVLILAMYMTKVWDVGVKQEFVVQLFTSLSGLTLCFFYISALTLLLRKEKWQGKLRPLGFTGQMALTNYLMQTILSVGIFVGFGFYGDVSLWLGTVICLVIFSLQMAFSTWWLKKFRFGPFEWLWRSFTYLRFQPMKKKEGLEEAGKGKAV
ncbi:DUF418 domain-containing protein [Lysinibacillus sphaericus]